MGVAYYLLTGMILQAPLNFQRISRRQTRLMLHDLDSTMGELKEASDCFSQASKHILASRMAIGILLLYLHSHSLLVLTNLCRS